MPSDADAIRALSDEWVAAANEDNLDRWMEIFTDDAIFMAPDTPIQEGKLAIHDWVKEAFFDVFHITLDNSMVDIKVADDFACGRLIASFTGVPKDGGETLRAMAKGTAVFRKQSDGAWKYTSAAFNWDAPLGG